MMHEGRIIADIRAEEKSRMDVEDLIGLFEVNSKSALANDRMLLG